MTFTKLPKSITAEELLSTPLPPVKWIIPGLLPAGLALFAGPSKAGKSWLTLWLCLQIAQGNPVWNREIEPRTVIYFSLEDTFNRLQNRIFQLIDGGDAPERLILQTECPSIGQGLEEQVESLIHTYRDVGLVVIDTLQKVRVSDGNGGMYANDYKEAGALKKLADKYGICILLIHHLRKQTASDPFEQISGSTGLMGVADTSWVMQRKRMSQTADILLTGRDMDDRTLHLREKNCVWTLEDLEKYNYQVFFTLTGANAIERIKELSPDLIILDLMLPFISGDELIRNIRKFSDVPVIVVSAKSLTFNKVELLRLGADDYLTKPFDLDELLARIERNLLRSQKDTPNLCLTFGELSINTSSKIVTVADEIIVLTAKEYQLVELLAKYPDKVFSKQNLYESIWQEPFARDNDVINTHISNLRKKLKGEGCRIKTIWGLGYRFAK